MAPMQLVPILLRAKARRQLSWRRRRGRRQFGKGSRPSCACIPGAVFGCQEASCGVPPGADVPAPSPAVVGHDTKAVAEAAQLAPPFPPPHCQIRRVRFEDDGDGAGNGGKERVVRGGRPCAHTFFDLDLPLSECGSGGLEPPVFRRPRAHTVYDLDAL